MTDEQGERVIALLEAILGHIEYVVMEPPTLECEHPSDQRVSLSSFGDLNHWVCKVCRFDNKRQ